MTLGTKVKEIREQKGWTQGQLASYADLGKSGRQYISLLEIDKILNPSVDKVLRIAKALEIPEDVLYEAAGLRTRAVPNTDLDDLVFYLHSKNPSPELVRQLRKIAEALLPGPGES